MWFKDAKIQHFVVENLSSKFMKKGVAFKIPLCYNNFCPLERAGRNRGNMRLLKNFSKKFKKVVDIEIVT